MGTHKDECVISLADFLIVASILVILLKRYADFDSTLYLEQDQSHVKVAWRIILLERHLSTRQPLEYSTSQQMEQKTPLHWPSRQHTLD